MNFDMNSSFDINSTITADEEETCRISNWLIAKAENDKQPLISVICAIAVLLLAGMIGNGLVIYVYSRKPKTTTNRIFILALAILDFLSCTVVIPFEIYDLGHTFTFTRTILCKLARFSEFMLILGAGFTLVAISIDRYVHLCRYKSRLLLTASRAKKVCGFCVFLGLCFAVPLLSFAGLEKIPLYVNGTNVTACGCTTFKNPNAKSGKIYTYLLMSVFLSALVTMLVSYCFIGATLYGRRQGKTRNGLTFITNTEETKRLHKTKAFPEMRKKESFAIGKSTFSLNGSTFIFLTVTVVFVIGFVPHLGVRVLRFLHLAFNEDTSMDLLYNFLVRSYLINSVSNPFIYSIIHKRFRDELLKTVKSIICCKKKSPLSKSQRSRTNSTNNETSFT